MTACERLLNTGHHLEVFKWDTGRETGIGVNFQNSEIKNGTFLVGTYGSGKTFEEACEDYIRKISGKTLVFNACTDNRKEILAI